MNNYSNHIAIIGAGIAGLVLSCILKKANIPVVLFEKSSDVSDYGAGISISPNGIKVLKYLNIYNEIISVSPKPKKAVFFSNNKKINSFDIDVITTSRKVLYKFLYNKYKSLDGEIFFDINPLFGRPRKLERSEALGLLAVAKAALTLPGTDAAALRTGVNKLEQALGIDSAMAVELPEPEHLLVLQQATANKEIIRIDYYAQWTDALSSRVVEPFETVNVSGDWYLRGHCRLRDAHRTFRVDRIEGVELTGEAHSRSDPGYEAFTGGDAAPVVKLNVPIGFRWMIESLPADFVDEGGRISVEMPTSSTVFLERLLLSLGADTHVDPDEFEQIRSEAARRLLERYNKN